MSNFYYVMKDRSYPELVSLVLDTLGKDKELVLVRDLTDKALLSGSPGEDPSLIPKLQGKTVVMEGDKLNRNHLSVLRDCYDGEVRACYANKVSRHYKNVDFDLVIFLSSQDEYEKLFQTMGGRLKPLILKEN